MSIWVIISIAPAKVTIYPLQQNDDTSKEWLSEDIYTGKYKVFIISYREHAYKKPPC